LGKNCISQAREKGPSFTLQFFCLPEKNLEVLFSLAEMFTSAFPRALPVAPAWGIRMPGTIPNDRVGLPKWHKPLAKLECVKPNNFRVIVWGNGLPCCLILFIDHCAFSRLTGWTKAHLERLKLPGLLLLFPSRIWRYDKNVCWQRGRMEKMPMSDFYA